MSKKKIGLGPSRKFIATDSKELESKEVKHEEVQKLLDEFVNSPSSSLDKTQPDIIEKVAKPSIFRTSLVLPATLHKEIKMRSFEEGTTMNDIILKILQKDFCKL